MFLLKFPILVLALLHVVDAINFWPRAMTDEPPALSAEEEAEIMAINYPEEKPTVMRRFLNVFPCTSAKEVQDWVDDEAGTLKDGRPVCNHYFHKHHNPVFCNHYARRHYEPTSFRGVRRGVMFAKKHTDRLFETTLHKLDRGGHVVRRNRRLLAILPIGRQMQANQSKREQLAYLKKQSRQQQLLLVQQQRKLIEQQRALRLLQNAPATVAMHQDVSESAPRAAILLAQIKENNAIKMLKNKAQAFYQTLPENAKSKVRQLEKEAKTLPQSVKLALSPFTRQTAPATAQVQIPSSELSDTTSQHPAAATNAKRVSLQQRHAAARRQLFNRASKREF